MIFLHWPAIVDKALGLEYLCPQDFSIHFRNQEGVMRIETTDPITGNTIKDPEGHLFIVEGIGDGALRIYFESEESRRTYQDIEVGHPGKDFKINLDNPAPR